jgi:hypothetical protein
MNKNVIGRFLTLLFFLFYTHAISYAQNNFKRNYLGIQPGLVISRDHGRGNSYSIESKNFSVPGEQMGITYKYFSRSRFMFGFDFNLSHNRDKNTSRYLNTVVNYTLYNDVSVTNTNSYYFIDLPQYVGYSAVKSHNFCFSIYAGWMPRIFLTGTESRKTNYAALNFTNKPMVVENHVIVDGLLGMSLDFKLSEKLALEFSPKYSLGFSELMSLQNIYLPISIIRSIK